MALQIIPFRTSINTAYILKDRGAVLVDAGYNDNARDFSHLLASHQIDPEDIQLILPTHGDFDHAGGAGTLRELTGAKIALHEKDRDIVEKGIFHWPHGVTPWGRVSRAMLLPFMKNKVCPPPTKVDLVLGDEGMSLKEYGIDGQVVYTPGHTYGSISVVLESGDAFVGCMAHNRPPFVLKPKLPIYALDIELLKESWAKIIKLGAETIWPGHGKPFPLERILKYLN